MHPAARKKTPGSMPRNPNNCSSVGRDRRRARVCSSASGSGAALVRASFAPALLSALAVVLAATNTAGAADPPASRQPPTAAAPAPSTPLGLPPGAVMVLKEMPAFQSGLWEFRRTVEGAATAAAQPDAVRKCSDPINDIRRKMTEMMGKGCRLTGMTHNGNRYHSSWSCMVEDGSVAVSNLIIADTTTAYQDVNESRYGKKTTRSVVDATRV